MQLPPLLLLAALLAGCTPSHVDSQSDSDSDSDSDANGGCGDTYRNDVVTWDITITADTASSLPVLDSYRYDVYEYSDFQADLSFSAGQVSTHPMTLGECMRVTAEDEGVFWFEAEAENASESGIYCEGYSPVDGTGPRTNMGASYAFGHVDVNLAMSCNQDN